MKSVLPGAALVIFLAFCLFVVAFQNHKTAQIQHAMQEHAEIVSGSIWDLNPEGIKEYLSAVVMHYNYEQIVIQNAHGTTFIEVQHPGLNPFESKLVELTLIPRVSFSADIHYNKEFLGTVQALWLDKSIFVDAYALLVCLLLFAVVQLYYRILKAKSTLEEKVESRTRMLHDKTKDLQKSEDLYRSLVENLGIGVALISPRMEILAVNRQMKAWFPGIDEADRPFCYRSFSNPPQETICTYCPTVRTFKDGMVHEVFTEISTHDALRHFRIISSPVRDESGRVTGVIELIEDRTEQIKTEEDTRELRTLLEQSQKMEAIGTLAGGIAHDFNNILSAIYGYTELARVDSHDPETLQHDLDEVLKGAERAKELVKQILTFSRKAEHEKQVLLISSVVKEALKLLRSLIPTTISIKEEIFSDAFVFADPSKIHQIVMNLCVNAYHAMRESGGTLTVSLREVEPPAGLIEPDVLKKAARYLQLEVLDTGKGMDEKTKLKIFDPYFTTKGIGEGTGLGLAVVHGVVKDHGGSISVHSELGHGSSFQVYLPIHEAELSESVIRKDEGCLVGGDETIMFVDDDANILEIVQQSLSRYGYKVYTFNNGVQAYQVLQENPAKFDLLLTDMTMPFITGAELAMKALEICPGLPVILCTGHSDLINREKALAMGIREYCQKPLKEKQMVSMIRNVLDNRDVNPG